MGGHQSGSVRKKDLDRKTHRAPSLASPVGRYTTIAKPAYKHQQTENPHAERNPHQEAECRDVASARRGKLPRDSDEQQRRPHHRGCERNVLGVVEHCAVPRAAADQRDRGDQARARTRDQSCRRRSGTDPPNADQRTQDVTQIVRVDRDQVREGDGNNVE